MNSYISLIIAHHLPKCVIISHFIVTTATDEKELSGLPEGTVEAAKQLAESKEKEGWLFTLDYPSYIPFVTYAKNRDLRKKLTLAAGSKGFHNDALDNQDIVLKIAKLRFQRANLLGYKTHAHFVLEERMAETPEKVEVFLNDLLNFFLFI